MLLLASASVARAADTNSPPMMPQDYFEGGTNTYNNWVELSTGGFLTRGNQAQADEIQHWSGGAFGGIEDLHLQGNAFTDTTFTLDGHSVFDQHDYDLKLRLEHPEKWYLQFNFDSFRTWSDDIGGFYPPTGTQYSGSSDALALDRGEFSFLGGLTLDNLPSITFKYTHSYRNGDKSSTIWGPVDVKPNTAQNLYPSFYDIDETVDAFDLNAKQHIKATDLGLGLHYEHGGLNDALNSTLYQGESDQSDLTDREKNTYDLFSVNATSETWFKNNLMLSAGGMFANLDNNFSGSRIYGAGFDADYSPGPYNVGYYNMTGDSHLEEYVMDLNLLAIPAKTFVIIPSVRVQKESISTDSSGTGTDSTLYDATTGPFNEQSSEDQIDVTEALDLRYTGVTNWVYSARGEWNEGQGNVNENGGIGPTNGFLELGGSPVTEFFPVNNETDDRRLFQKYSLSARWYPLRSLIVDAGGYYKDNRYDYNFPVDSTPNDAGIYNNLYPGFLSIQRFRTYDGNVRLTLRPVQNVSLTSRYEYQLSTIDTTPDPASGFGVVESSRMISHILAQDVSWIPWSRLSLQASFNYVLSETKTPASDYTQAILNAQNNYWTVNFSSSFVVDDKTTFDVNYFYYQADDYQDNSVYGVPLGTGSREHGVTATLTRRINPHLRVNLKYSYYNYKDALTCGNSNFEAQMVYASLQYRF
jgi:hypothetical protein